MPCPRDAHSAMTNDSTDPLLPGQRVLTILEIGLRTDAYNLAKVGT